MALQKKRREKRSDKASGLLWVLFLCELLLPSVLHPFNLRPFGIQETQSFVEKGYHYSDRTVHYSNNRLNIVKKKKTIFFNILYIFMFDFVLHVCFLLRMVTIYFSST